MRALHLEGSEARVRELDEPSALSDEARVRVSLAGICNTDLELVKGYMGFRGVLGHEFVGVEATGTAQGFALAVAATQPRCSLVLKSTVAGHTNADLAPLVINEITVVGSRCGPFPPAILALAENSIDVRPLVSDQVPLCDALRRAAEPGTLKVLVEP